MEIDTSIGEYLTTKNSPTWKKRVLKNSLAKVFTPSHKGYLMKKPLWLITKPLPTEECIETCKSQAQIVAKDEKALSVLLTSLE